MYSDTEHKSSKSNMTTIEVAVKDLELFLFDSNSSCKPVFLGRRHLTRGVCPRERVFMYEKNKSKQIKFEIVYSPNSEGCVGLTEALRMLISEEDIISRTKKTNNKHARR